MRESAALSANGMRGGAPATPSGIQVEGNRRDEGIFAAAQRHSRRVRALKIVLPLAGLVIAAGFAGYSYITTPPKISVDATGTALKDGKLVMANPRLDGFTKDNLPYSMTAMRAIQDMSNAGVIQLEEIDATFPVSATNSATVDAPTGTYDRNKNTLDFNEHMTVTTTDGMVARLQSAYLDLGQGVLTTDDPVDISTSDSHISAESMALSEGGKVMVFENRVRVVLDRGKTVAARNGEGNNAAN